MTSPRLAAPTSLSCRTEHVPAIPEAQTLAEGMTQLKQILLDLLADSLRLQTGQGPIARPTVHSYLALARACAHELQRLHLHAQRAGYLPDPDQPMSACPRHNLAAETWLDRLPMPPLVAWPERDTWRRLAEAGQYTLLVERIADLVRHEASVLPEQSARTRRPRGQRRGMGRVPRRLAELALRLRQDGIAWSRLLAAIIEELEAELELDALDQVLLEQLRTLEMRAQPEDSGAYLRTTVARYKTDLALRSEQVAEEVG